MSRPRLILLAAITLAHCVASDAQAGFTVWSGLSRTGEVSFGGFTQWGTFFDWGSALGPVPTGIPGDANEDGKVDIGDFTYWGFALQLGRSLPRAGSDT